MNYVLKCLLISLSVLSFSLICYSMQNNDLTVNVHLYNAILEDGSYECQVCKQNFKAKVKFGNHMHKEHGEYIFKCNVCRWESSLESSVFLHKKKRHNIVDSRTKKRICHSCGDIFAAEIVFIKHIKFFHTNELMQADSCKLKELIIDSIERFFPRSTQMKDISNVVEPRKIIKDSVELPYN